MAWRELWSVTHFGSKLSAGLSPDGSTVSIGITNMLARVGIAEHVPLDEARQLGRALIAAADAALPSDPAPAPDAS